ncbi:MAG: hypothetical protein HQK83_16990 [Fibrobacteria bacterium]|nr:hypothetical protein [Fibrobacteria bacterium]
MRLIYLTLIFLVTNSFPLENIFARKLIDGPTTGLLSKAYYDLNFRFFFGGGLTTSVDLGVGNNINLGIGWGIDHLINQGKVDFFIPGVALKYRALQESYQLPSIALGFDNRPLSSYTSYQNRHYFKSKGLFLVISKNYLFLGSQLGMHAGVNYSVVDNRLETYGYTSNDGANDFPNLYFGFDKVILGNFSIMMEYDCAMDDNLSHNPFEGYLHAAARYFFLNAILIELDFKDLFQNKKIYWGRNNYNRGRFSRELQISHIRHF